MSEVQLRLPKGLTEAVKARAETDGVSMAEVIRRALLRYLNASEKVTIEDFKKACEGWRMS